MNDLVRAYYQHMRDKDSFENLGRAVVEGIWPFEPGKIDAYIHEDWGSGRTLRVYVENLPNHDFVMSLDLISLVQEPDGGLFKIYQRVFKHYRYRPALPVDDHIVLGEE
jgi:hypothetical protein